jgi:hypothetical protein
VVQDFESGCSIASWPRDGHGKATLSTDWAADGAHSLKIDPGIMGSFKELRLGDWTGYDVLRFQVRNSGSRTARLGLEIQDRHDAFDDRHQRTLGVAPGVSAVEIDIAGGLWRGEENRPYRGKEKAPIDLSRITRVGFTNDGAAPLFVDGLVIERVPRLATPGGFAFDFGRSGKQVMGQTVGVFETTAYTAERGFGMLGGPPSTLRFAMSYPSPLLGDGLAFDKGGFRVDLPGGKYLGWIAFERGGFWEDEQSGYAHADVLVNGAAVTGHDFSPSGAHFFFEDTEITDPAQIEEKLIRPAHAVSRFRFEAARGGNVFTLAVSAPRLLPLRVAGLFLAPDTPEGSAFIDAHERRQREAIAASYPPEDRGRRAGRAALARDLVIEALPPGAVVYPRDLPAHAESTPPGEITAVAGQTATLHLGLHAARDLAVRVEVRPVTGPDQARLPSPVISHGRYLPTRPLGGGPVWIEVNHYRPEPDFHVAPGLARSVIVEWRVPRSAAPGAYTGAIAITAGGAVTEVPLRIKVVAVDLPEIPVPVGLLMSGLPFGPEAVGEARWWELTEALLDEQARAGLTCVTGGAGLDFSVQKSAGGITLGGDRPLRYLELARRRSMARAAMAYGGFSPRLDPGWVDAAALGKAWSVFAAERQIQPFFWNLYDEPGTRAEFEAAIAAATPFTRAGLFTMGFSSMRRGDALFDQLIDATYAPALNVHEERDLRDLVRRGKHPWIYNNGMDRYALGLHLWRNIRAGAEGRLEWIGLITQGFAFDDLDGREPSPCSWQVHDRLGLMPTPRWLAAREGLLDLRVRLALERLAPPGDPALAAWPPGGYGADRERWTEAALGAARALMLERLSRAPGAPSEKRSPAL